MLLNLLGILCHTSWMNAKVDSGTPPKTDAKNDAIVNRLTCETLEGVNAQVIEVEATFKRSTRIFSGWLSIK